MSVRTLEATGPADPATAWERYALPGRWPEWAPHVRRVELSSARLTAGATGRLHAEFGVSLGFTVDAVDEESRRWSWTVRVGLLRLRLEHWIAPAPGGGTTTGMRVSGPRPLVAAYAGEAQAALDRVVAAAA